MKKSLVVLIVAMLLVLATASLASAGKFEYTTGIQVQNLEATSADINMTYFNKDGSVEATVDDTIAASGSATYFPIGADPGFDGSVVVSADKQIAAIVNILGDGGAASASYVGMGAGATTVNLPLLMSGNSGYDTWFNVQNTGATDATVDVSFSDGTEILGTVIKPGAVATFDQALDGLAHDKVFSGIVTSNQPIVATVIEESNKVTDVLFAYNGFATGSKFPVMPLVNMNNAGYVTGIQIQNTNDLLSTTVTVSYTPSLDGTACTETHTINPGDSETFTLFAFTNTGVLGSDDCIDLDRFVGSAQVTANTGDVELVAIVNQLSAKTGEAYGGFDATAATDTVVAPLIMDRNAGFFTGLQVMNVGAGPTDVLCTFTGPSGYTVSDTLAAGEALTTLTYGTPLGAGYVGSGTCTSTGEPLVGVVNELGPNASKTDQLLVYETINN